MLDSLFATSLSKAITLLTISAMPVVELRAAIPIGAAQGLPFWETYLMCILGNMLPVPFAILFTQKIFGYLKQTKLFRRPTLWIENHVMKKAPTLYKYHFLGLVILVAIPLPGTGAWTGAILSALLGMRMKRSLPAILLGVVIAATVVAGMSYGFIRAISLFVPGL